MTQQLVQDEEGEGFWMGSTDKLAQPNEAPRHHVTLDPFWIDKTEVTNAQYKLPSRFSVHTHVALAAI